MSKKLTPDQKRNLHVLIVACVLNFSFAIEKLCNITGHQQSDFVWFCVYGWFWLYLVAIAVYDYIHDVKEGSSSNKNALI